MSSSFENSFDQYAGDSPASGDGYFVPDSFSKPDSAAAESPSPFYASGCEFASDPAYLSSEANENCPILPPPDEMDPEEGYALGEWRWQNTIRLEEKEKREKELLSKILIEAEEYKVELHGKRQLTCESNKATNREKEKIFVASQEKFHVEADKDYWKSITDLIPKELPTMEKKKKQPSVAVVKGPKPGKPTDLARMRQILVKLDGNTPSHLKPSPSRPPASDGNNTAPKMPSAAQPVAVA